MQSRGQRSRHRRTDCRSNTGCINTTDSVSRREGADCSGAEGSRDCLSVRLEMTQWYRGIYIVCICETMRRSRRHGGTHLYILVDGA
jgi:hypothetical protein